MLVSNFLVDGPKICRGVVDRSGFQIRDRLLQPEKEQV